MLLQEAPTAVTGITGIFEDLEWFPEGRPLVDSMDSWKYKRNVALSRLIVKGDLLHITQRFSFHFGRTWTVIYWLTLWQKKKKNLTVRKWLGCSRVQKYTFLKPKAENEYIFIFNFFSLIGDLKKMCQTIKTKFYLSPQPWICCCNSNRLKLANWSSIWLLILFVTTHCHYRIMEYGVDSMAFVVIMQTPLVP